MLTFEEYQTMTKQRLDHSLRTLALASIVLTFACNDDGGNDGDGSASASGSDHAIRLMAFLLGFDVQLNPVELLAELLRLRNRWP